MSHVKTLVILSAARGAIWLGGYVAAGAALAIASATYVAHAGAATPALPVPPIARDVAKLPPEVQRMRQAILQAATSGDIEALRVPIEMNEIHPVFAKSHLADPIAHLKSVSGDGNGREMLAILYNVLTTGYAVQNAGTAQEMYIWPYHAVLPLKDLTPSQEVEIYRFLPPARVKEMTAQGSYAYYKVGIARNGVWHYFSAE